MLKISAQRTKLLGLYRVTSEAEESPRSILVLGATSDYVGLAEDRQRGILIDSVVTEKASREATAVMAAQARPTLGHHGGVGRARGLPT